MMPKKWVSVLLDRRSVAPGLKIDSRFGPAATTCAKASRQPTEGRIYMKHVAPHEIPGPKSVRPHGGIPSSAAERPMGGF
jgi:hypothetical protein